MALVERVGRSGELDWTAPVLLEKLLGSWRARRPHSGCPSVAAHAVVLPNVIITLSGLASMRLISVVSEMQLACRTSPCDHARALHDGEPCQQMVGVVVAADREQIVEAAVADVAAGEGL